MPIDSALVSLVPGSSVDSSVKHSHEVERVVVAGLPGKTWISKTDDAAICRAEVLAQEFFRLIIPHQPETLLSINPTTSKHDVLSEEVPGFRPIEPYKSHRFGDGTYTGLGQAVLCAMFLQEIDLKNGNIGIDHRNRVIKIDGDWCFASGNYKSATQFNITPRALENLPYPVDFDTFNWLGCMEKGIAYPVSPLVDRSLAKNPQFAGEMHQAMLMICLIPDCFIERFVRAHMTLDVTRDGKDFIEVIKARRRELQISAAAYPPFVAYLKTAQASGDAERILEQMRVFTAAGTPIMTVEEHDELARGLDGEKTKLFRSVEAEIAASESRVAARLVIDCNALLGVLAHDSDVEDTLLRDFIRTKRLEIRENSTNVVALTAIQSELTRIYNLVNSPEVRAVKEVIVNLRAEAGLFTVGKFAKAARIQDALRLIPLEERGTVISSTRSNPVQEALASHRLESGRVYKVGERINEEKAAASFLKLKSRFTSVARPTARSGEDADASDEGDAEGPSTHT